MINRLHASWRRPENGWDPISSDYSDGYSEYEWGIINSSLLDELEARVGGFAGKSVLDLGGGPGQYTVALAQRGAEVIWHDVSNIYRSIAERKAKEHGVAGRVHFSIGYLDEAPQILGRQFDFVFNRVCWNYGFSDRGFTDVIYRLVTPGGCAYVDATHSAFRLDELGRSVRLRTWLNDHLWIKLGHSLPPHGRLARLFMRYPMRLLIIDYRSPYNDRIFFQKA